MFRLCLQGRSVSDAFLILTYLGAAVKFFVGLPQGHSILRNYWIRHLFLGSGAKSSEI